MRAGLPIAVGRPLARALGAWVFGPDVPVDDARRRLELASRGIPTGRGVSVRSGSLGGVPCERVSAGEAAVVLYLHGGAYLVGSPRTHRALAAGLARRLHATVWVADYRLAPENPFPAALDDALAAYRVLVADVAPDTPVIVAGESAGGGLTLALAMRLRDMGERAPDALALLSPWVDPSTDLRGARAPAPAEPLLRPAFLRDGAWAYAAGHDPRGPGISPLHGDLRGLPPIVVSSGTDDVLLPDADRLERRAREAGAGLVHQRHAGLWHAFHAFAPAMPAAAAALDDLAVALGAATRRRATTVPTPEEARR